MAETKRDPYEILGIDKNATQDDIKHAYRTLAKKYHPDINKEPGAEEKFKEIQGAYDILSDPDKKAKYDQFGYAAFDGSMGGGFQGGNPFEGFGGFEDIFESFFGGGGRRGARSSGPIRGNDTSYKVRISFMDAVKGKTIVISPTVEETCSHCNGTGARTPNDFQTCPDCNGSGRIRTVSNTLFGRMQQERACPRCNATGRIIKEKCTFCNGKGYISSKKDIEIKIPAGIQSGQSIVIQGRGKRGVNGGPNGDLYVEVVVDDSKEFTRDGNDIHVDTEISYLDAILGSTIDVNTVDGPVSVKIPAGTQPNAVLRLQGKGIKALRSNQIGDQFIHIKVKIPTSISKEEKEILENLRSKKASKGSSFFDRLFK